MAAFNFRHLIREVPGKTWRDYLATRSIEVADDFDWDAEETALADALIAQIESLDDSERLASIHSELRRVHRLAHRKGIFALLNASNKRPEIQEGFEGLCNGAERALWTLIHWPEVFQVGDRLLQFDLSFGTRSWKRQTIKVSEPVSRETDDIQALEAALAQLMSRRKGPKRACRVDVCDRHLDGGIQVSIYIEDDPNDLVEFVEHGMKRRTTRPACSLALVYYPIAGLVDSIGKGGARVHIALVTLFAKHLLKRDVKPEEVKQPMFHLNRLRHGLEFFDDGEIDLAAHGVDCIRLRQVRLRSTVPPQCDFWVEVPPDQNQACAFTASNSHLHDRDLFQGPFNLVEVVISVYFTPSEPGKTGHVLNIELKQSGVSNLRDMSEGDAKFADALLRAWQVTEPSEIEAKLAA